MWQDFVKMRGLLGLSLLRSIPLNPTYVDLCQKLYTPFSQNCAIEKNEDVVYLLVESMETGKAIH